MPILWNCYYWNIGESKMHFLIYLGSGLAVLLCTLSWVQYLKQEMRKVFHLIQIIDPSGDILFHPGQCPTLVGQWHGERRKLLAELRIRFLKLQFYSSARFPVLSTTSALRNWKNDMNASLLNFLNNKITSKLTVF